MADQEPYQPRPFNVMFIGEQHDIDIYIGQIKAAIESKADVNITRIGTRALRIFPRAVND